MRLVLALVTLCALACATPAHPDALARAEAQVVAGQIDAGRAALLRLTPQDPRFRLELAKALLATGDRDRARYHLQEARGAAGLTPGERAQLDRILTRIDGGKNHEAWVRLAISPESNPGQRMDCDSLMIGGPEFKLRPGAPSPAATGLHFAFGGALLPRLGSTGLRLRIGAAVDARLFERSALNDVILRGDLGVQGTTAHGATWAVAAFALDRRTSLTARVMHRSVTLRGSAPVMELGSDRQSSSIAQHSFRNTRVSLGLSREF